MTPQKSWKKRRAARRQGHLLLITAASSVFLMACAALAVDYGLLVADANRMQRACDAAALAGAARLKVTGDDNYDTYQAKVEAVRVAAQNGATVSPEAITFLSNNTQIRVPAATTRTFFFARAIGQNSGSLTRRATAGVAPGNNLSTGPGRMHVAPIGITWETYYAYNADRNHFHDLELVRQNKQVFEKDDAVLFDLRNDQESKSGAHMQDQLTADEIQQVNLNEYQTTLNAAQPSEQNHLTSGLDDLFDQSAQSPWNDTNHGNSGSLYDEIVAGTASRDNPRVAYIIITPSTSNPDNGTFNTQVQGFVPVYIESYSQRNNSGEQVMNIRVRFLPPGSGGDEGISPDPTARWSGVRVINLLD